MWPRLGPAFRNRLGLLLLAVGLGVAAGLLQMADARTTWLALVVVVLAVLSYGLTIAIHLWTHVPGDESEQMKALRRLRECMAEQLQAHYPGEASYRVLKESLERLDHEMMPAVKRLLRRHASVQRVLRRFRSGEILAPDQERMTQLESLCHRQERAVDNVGREVANAYASLIMLTQHADDDARLAAEAEEWSNHLFETQENLAKLLHEEAVFDPALEERSKRSKSA
jgi:DNA repair ATPase RecN